ncbi:aryl-sulfate sulfotransferase [Brachyspira sp. G79]|uniref:aryl-sulfate sulfotransferase n=1 Tax=Brachyspira sp. G79 TaxID=1358104 RepID=UPI000BBC21FC|nr:aryl-sulfate sulfotransferase [Brachyspira sp. G79]PCG21108.1 arylsulfotransferase [Brachyspira sp. G79]
MKKLLSIILLITSLFALSCNHNKSNSSSTSPIGKVGEIVVDPNGVTPLSAVYTTESVNAAPITVTVKGLYGEPDIIHTYPAGYGTEFEIHGMFPESQNIIEVNDGGRIIKKEHYVGALQFSEGETMRKLYQVFQDDLPEENYKNNPNLYFATRYSSVSPFYLIAVSRKGFVRYAFKYSSGFFAKLKIENKKLVIHDTLGIYDLLGNNKLSINNAHHDIIRKNDNYLHLSRSGYGIEDRLLETTSSGNKVRELSFAQLIKNSLDLGKYPEDEAVFNQIVFSEDINNIYNLNGVKIAIDWCHANSIVYDSDTDILYVSSRHRGVLAIDYSEWKLIWWMADNNFNVVIGTAYDKIPYDKHLKDLKSLEPYRVKGDGAVNGPKNQHALFLLANGNIAMFDNQGDEDTNPNGSRYAEYKITGTHGNYNAELIKDFRVEGKYSHYVSDVDFTENGNILFTHGSLGEIYELDQNSGSVLFYIDLTPQNGFLYRADKMPLYYDEGRVYSEDCNLKNPN